MPHRISSVLLAAGAASAVAAGVASIGTAGAHAAATSCSIPFTATPRVGPDRGHALSGTLTVNQGAGGALSGTLALKSGATVNWRGQLHGQAISLIIAIPKQGVLFGTGMLAEPLANGPLWPHRRRNIRGTARGRHRRLGRTLCDRRGLPARCVQNLQRQRGYLPRRLLRLPPVVLLRQRLVNRGLHDRGRARLTSRPPSARGASGRSRSVLLAPGALTSASATE